MESRLTRAGKPFCIYLLVLAAFAGGVVANRSGWLPGRSHYAPADLGHTFDPFWETWSLVERHYVDRQAVQPQRMTRGAIQGLLASLGDVGHTTYLTPAELRDLERGLKGYFEGIGARMTIRKGQPTIIQTFPDSPARAAGLQAGDVLKAVNDQSVSDLSLARIVEMVRGPAGTTVHLRVLRKGETDLLDLAIKRARVDVADVAWHMLPGVPIAHVAVRSFGDQADAQLRQALKQARRRGARGLLLDVRGNPGGLKDQAVAVTSEFLKGGTVFIEQNAQGKRTRVPVKPGGEATAIPVCVLIDEGTASSAEILAAALQDHGRARLVGTHTFGTGTVLRAFLLSDGSAVLLAVTEWLTPRGRQIWHKGVQPDVVVALTEGAEVLLPEEENNLSVSALEQSQDKQLLKALEILRKQLRRREYPNPHGSP